MSQPQCTTGCGRPAGRMLCEHCLWSLKQALAELPALLSELSTSLTRQAVMAERSDGGRSAETPVVFNVAASQVLDDMRTYLVGWVRVLAEDSVLVGPICDEPGGRLCPHGSCAAIRRMGLPQDSLASMGRWLLNRLDEIAMHEAASDIWDEIVGVCKEGWRVVDRAANRTRFEVGPCPELVEEDGAQCPGEVWAFIPTHESGAARLECRSCGTRWETHQWMRAGRRILAEMDRRSKSERLLHEIFGRNGAAS